MACYASISMIGALTSGDKRGVKPRVVSGSRALRLVS